MLNAMALNKVGILATVYVMLVTQNSSRQPYIGLPYEIVKLLL